MDGFPAIAQALFLVAGISALVAAVVGYQDRPKVDPYSFEALERIHEQEELRNLEVEEPEEYDGVMCNCCHTVYSPRFPTCPECAKRRKC